MLALTDSGLGYIAIANLGGPAAAGPCVESTCRDIFTARFCCAVRATGSLKSSARTVAPTRAPLCVYHTHGLRWPFAAFPRPWWARPRGQAMRKLRQPHV